jgi:hypothetical protein
MKRGRVALLCFAAVAVFLVVIFFYLPASWFRSFLPPQVACAELGGSVWGGECLGLSVLGTKLGDANWNLAPLPALGGRLVGDVDLRSTLAQARAELDLNFTGAGDFRNVTAQFPLDPAFLAQFPTDRRGQIAVALKHAVVAQQSLRQIEGTIELRNFRQVGRQPLELGSYRVSFDGKAQADGKIVGTVSDTGGPFRIEGRLVLVPPNEYNFQGSITGRSADAERLIRDAMPYSRPDASGRSELSFEGSY